MKKVIEIKSQRNTVFLITEPGSKHLGLFTTDTGSSFSTHSENTRFLEMKSFPRTSLVAIICDGTNVNTGKKSCDIK